MTAAQATTIVIVRPARSFHETVNMVRTPTTTLYRHAFSKPALGASLFETTGRSRRIEACDRGGVRREPRFRVGASLPITANLGGCLGNDWFKPRGYRHFDAPVGASYADMVCDPTFVAKHSWLPLIHYVKRIKRYKAKDGKTAYKDRDIMFASHRDACILAKYAS